MDTRVPGSAARLTDLPTEVLGIICRQLSLKDRVCLSITCRALLHNLANSEDAWGTLDLMDESSSGKLPFILPWLSHRRQSLRHLFLDFSESEVPHVAAKLAACLEGSPLLDLGLCGLRLPGEEGAASLQWLGSCTALTLLTLYSCGLTCLPDTLQQLPALAELCLRYSDLDEASWVPLQQLTALTGLYLECCQLDALPAELAALPALAVLSLEENLGLGDAAEDAWAPLARCSSLTSLLLGDIPFTRLPQALAALAPTLVALNFCPELLVDGIPIFEDEASLDPLAMLTGLTWLNLSKCLSLTDLPMPEQLSCLVGLRFLDLSCTTSNVEEGAVLEQGGAQVHFLRHLTALTWLSLRDCGLEEFPEELSCLVALQNLDLSWNPLTGEGRAMHPLRHLTALTILSFGGCGLEDLPEELSCLVALQDLDLSCNNFMDIPHDSWHRLRRPMTLTRLDLTNCNLERLPPELAELRSLAELNLCENKLLGWSALDAADKWAVLEQLTALTQLDASKCDLHAVPTTFGALAGLRVLTLSRNPDLGRGGVEALRPLVRMTALQYLDLSWCSLPQELEKDAIPFPLHRLEGWAERIEGLPAWESRKLTLG